ncbi:MAG TPA: DUF4296 domain-containing protein [Saprospiraceae bacterium]|nr:DUF4296 domain-containing protein [Saprospiraceae bacterium]
MHNCILSLIVFTVIALILGCERRTEIILPSDNVLIDLIYDLHVAEASLNRVNTANQDSVADLVRARIAASYGIKADQMDAWLEILQKSPDHLIVIYDSVITRFEKEIPKQ